MPPSSGRGVGGGVAGGTRRGVVPTSVEEREALVLLKGSV